MNQTVDCLEQNEKVKYNSKSISISRERLYGVWNEMKQRCSNPNNEKYYVYGKRGIHVCDKWKHSYLEFKEWALKNGYEKGLTIDRIDVNGNYEPDNCRWISQQVQQNNRRNNSYVEYDGIIRTKAQMCKLYGISQQSFNTRLNRGYSVKESLYALRKYNAEKQSDSGLFGSTE